MCNNSHLRKCFHILFLKMLLLWQDDQCFIHPVPACPLAHPGFRYNRDSLISIIPLSSDQYNTRKKIRHKIMIADMLKCLFQIFRCSHQKQGILAIFCLMSDHTSLPQDPRQISHNKFIDSKHEQNCPREIIS